MGIIKKPNETNESFVKRQWFISQFKGDYNLGVKLSNMWINMINIRCTYPQKYNKMIFDIIKNSNKYNNYKNLVNSNKKHKD